MMRLQFHGRAIELLKLGKNRIIITGASGWLGMALLEMLSNLLQDEFAARIYCFGSSYKKLTLRNGITVLQSPLSQLKEMERQSGSVLLHMAFLTKDKTLVTSPEQYIADNRVITETILAALPKIGVDSVFLPSSGAVYGVEDQPYPQNLYAQLKLQDESLISEWAKANDKISVIARIFNVTGPYMNKTQTYVLSSIIIDAINKRPIRIKANKRVTRSYIAIDELMSVVMYLLLDPTKNQYLFDASGTEVMEVGEMAQRILSNLSAILPIDRPEIDPNIREDRYIGSGEQYRKFLLDAQVSEISFEKQISSSVEDLDAEARLTI